MMKHTLERSKRAEQSPPTQHGENDDEALLCLNSRSCFATLHTAGCAAWYEQVEGSTVSDWPEMCFEAASRFTCLFIAASWFTFFFIANRITQWLKIWISGYMVCLRIAPGDSPPFLFPVSVR